MNGVRGSSNLSATPTVDELINALFDGPNRQSAQSQWKNIQKDVANGGNNLQSHIDNVTKWALGQLTDGGILDPDGTGPLNPTSGCVKMLGLIFTFANAFPTSLPPLPGGFNAGWSIFNPSTPGNQTTTTSFGDAAAVVPPGTFNQKTMVVVVRQPDLPFVNTPFPKLSKTVDVAIAPEVSFTALTVLMCPGENTDHAANARAVIAHQKSATEVEYLNPAQAGSLTCPHGIGSAWRQEKGFLRQRTMQLASYAGKAWDFIGPRPLYAGHAAIGGSVEDFLSPMVVVDPYLATGIVVNPIGDKVYGSNVEVSARLGVTEGPAGFVGNPVAAQSVLASLDGGAPQPATTDASGNTTWQFAQPNAGSHSLSFSFAGANTPENAPFYGASTAIATFNVAQSALTVTVNNAQRLYGDPNPAFSGSVVGALNGDAITASYSTTATTASAAGQYPITATLSAAAGVLANYAVTIQPGVLTINPAPLTLGAANATREYGLANPTFAGSIVGTKNNDALTLAFQTPATILSSVGTYPIVPSATGGAISNYVVQSVTNGTLTITPAPLSLTVANASRTYGDPNPSFGGSLVGVRNNDLLTVAYSTTATQSSHVGSYPITGSVSGAKFSNYALTSSAGTLSITPAPLTVALVGGFVPYGTNPCVVTYTGFKLADNASSLTGTLVCTVNGVPLAQPAPSGTYFITPGGLSSSDYGISFVGGTVRVGYNTPTSFLTPVPNSQFGVGRTIPVKFQLLQTNGAPVTTAVATVAMTGMTIPPNLAKFVYSGGTYSVNLDTPKTLSPGAHTITATLDDGSTIAVTVIMK